MNIYSLKIKPTKFIQSIPKLVGFIEGALLDVLQFFRKCSNDVLQKTEKIGI